MMIKKLAFIGFSLATVAYLHPAQAMDIKEDESPTVAYLRLPQVPDQEALEIFAQLCPAQQGEEGLGIEEKRRKAFLRGENTAIHVLKGPNGNMEMSFSRIRPRDEVVVDFTWKGKYQEAIRGSSTPLTKDQADILYNGGFWRLESQAITEEGLTWTGMVENDLIPPFSVTITSPGSTKGYKTIPSNLRDFFRRPKYVVVGPNSSAKVEIAQVPLEMAPSETTNWVALFCWRGDSMGERYGETFLTKDQAKILERQGLSEPKSNKMTPRAFQWTYLIKGTDFEPFEVTVTSNAGGSTEDFEAFPGNLREFAQY